MPGDAHTVPCSGLRDAEKDIIRHDERLITLFDSHDDIKKGQRAIESKFSTLEMRFQALEDKIGRIWVRVGLATGAIAAVAVAASKAMG